MVLDVGLAQGVRENFSNAVLKRLVISDAPVMFGHHPLDIRERPPLFLEEQFLQPRDFLTITLEIGHSKLAAPPPDSPWRCSAPYAPRRRSAP